MAGSTVGPQLSKPRLSEARLFEPSIIRIQFQVQWLYSLSINSTNHAHMMLICFTLICLIFAHSERLAIWEIKERNSFNHALSLLCTRTQMSEMKDIAGTEFDELLQQVHLGEVDVVNSRINERLDMSEELLVVVLAPADDILNTSWMPWEVSGTVFDSWMLPLMGVVIVLLDHGHQLFTYLYFWLIRTNF